MPTQDKLFARPLSITDLQERYKKVWAGIFSFFTEGCCIDTEPPLPTGM